MLRQGFYGLNNKISLYKFCIIMQDQFQGVRNWMNSASINISAAGRESIPWGKSWYLDLLENKIFSTRLQAVEQLLQNIRWTNYIRSSEACTSFLQIQNFMQSR